MATPNSWPMAVVTLACLAGCANAPPPPQVPATELPTAFKAAQTADQPGAAPQPAGAPWWLVFDDPQLDALVQRALRNNTDLAIAAARLAQARATLGSTLSRTQPQLNASASAGRQGGPLLNDAGSSGNLFSAGLQLGYEVDLSGALASSTQAAQLDAQARDSLMRSARLMVQADVARTYLALRATDAERRLALRTLQAWQQTLQISQARLQQGTITAMAVQRQQAELHAAQAEAGALDRRRAELAHTLAVLLGEVASQFHVAELPEWSPRVPTIPNGLPSNLLQRRADVAAAVQQFQAARARTTSAQQAWWPSLALTASGGQASPTLADLLKSSTRAFGIGAVLAIPVFDGGRREANVAQGQAEEAIALAQHRERVLTAFKEVEDQLVALQVLAVQAEQLGQASALSQQAAGSATSLWRNGLASHLEVLDAQRSAWRHEGAALQAQAARQQATVGLIRALGGGWGDASARPMLQPLAQAPGS